MRKSEKYGTKLTTGPRLKKLIRAGYADILWEERYPAQEAPTSDGRGEFQTRREWIERASLEDVFDLWLRGRNLMGYAQKAAFDCHFSDIRPYLQHREECRKWYERYEQQIFIGQDIDEEKPCTCGLAKLEEKYGRKP